LSDWWQEFSTASDSVREDLLQQVRQEQQKAQRAPRVYSVRRAPKPEAEDPRFRDVESEGEEGTSAPAKKRRRRRRKPTGEAGGAPATE
jgi:poly(A) polymerase